MPLDRQSDTEPQTAMLLTQKEWDDLTAICQVYKREMAWAMAPEFQHGAQDQRRRSRLCDRIIEANS